MHKLFLFPQEFSQTRLIFVKTKKGVYCYFHCIFKNKTIEVILQLRYIGNNCSHLKTQKMKLTMNAMRNLPLLNLIVILTVIYSIFLFDTTSAARKARRCFNCRSRGELGDCRDPFYLSANSTLVKNSKKGEWFSMKIDKSMIIN